MNTLPSTLPSSESTSVTASMSQEPGTRDEGIGSQRFTHLCNEHGGKCQKKNEGLQAPRIYGVGWDGNTCHSYHELTGMLKLKPRPYFSSCSTSHVYLRFSTKDDRSDEESRTLSTRERIARN